MIDWRSAERAALGDELRRRAESQGGEARERAAAGECAGRRKPHSVGRRCQGTREDDLQLKGQGCPKDEHVGVERQSPTSRPSAAHMRPNLIPLLRWRAQQIQASINAMRDGMQQLAGLLVRRGTEMAGRRAFNMVKTNEY